MRLNSDISGKVAIVTGAANGIGAEIATRLAAAGAIVLATDVADAGPTAEAINSQGGIGAFRPLDVTAEKDWEAVLDHVRQTWGRLDILVNNAGISISGPVEEQSDEIFTQLFDVNMRSVFLGTKHAIALMKQIPTDQDSGAIVNISSIAGIRAAPNGCLYSATKGAVRLFTKSVALEFLRLGYNVRCNSVHPGLVETQMGARALERVDAEGRPTRDAVIATYPMNRLARTTDIAEAALYLASPASGYVTGTELIVDGGYTA